MNVGSFIRSLRARGLTVRIAKTGRLVVRPTTSLSDDERAYLRENASAIARALPSIDFLAAQYEQGGDDAALAALTRESNERHARERARERVEWLASLRPDQLSEHVDKGAVSLEDLKKVLALQDRVAHHLALCLHVSAATGLPIGAIHFFRGN